MNKRAIWFLYGSTLLFAVIFFTYYLFPGEKFEKHILITFSHAFPDYELIITHTGPAFPPTAVKLSGVKVMHADNTLLESDFVKIGFPLWSIFSPETTLSMKGGLYDGLAKGIIKMAKGQAPERVMAEFQLSGIRIEKIPAIQQMAQSGISGAVGGSFTYDSAASVGQAVAVLHLEDVTMPLFVSFQNIDDISFNAVELAASLSRPDLSVTQCTFKGKQLDGQLTGKMTLKEPADESMLSFEGTIQPQHEFLKNFPVQMLPARQTNKNGYPFKISGTIRKPGFSFR